MKYLIISQPKAGTHLTAELLKTFELKHTHLQIHEDNLTQFVWKDDKIKKERINNGGALYNISNMKESLIYMSHLLYSKEKEILLKNVKKILVTRPKLERDSALRRANFKYSRKRELDSLNILEWRGKEEVFEITFDDLISENTEKIDQLQEYLFGEIRFDSKEKIQQAKAAKTMTKSELRI